MLGRCTQVARQDLLLRFRGRHGRHERLDRARQSIVGGFPGRAQHSRLSQVEGPDALLPPTDRGFPGARRCCCAERALGRGLGGCTLNSPHRTTPLAPFTDSANRCALGLAGHPARPAWGRLGLHPAVAQRLCEQLSPGLQIGLFGVEPLAVVTATGDRQVHVEVVKDYVPHLPLNHKADHPATLAPSLLTAVRVFVLTRAIRILRGQGRQHCTMMINVSRFNAIQEKVHGEVYIYLQTLQNAAAMAMGPDALSDPVIAEFKEDFHREFADGEETFDAVRTVLADAARVQALTVNMKGGVLDYRAHRENGLHVIAIGGLALSRGLTLEGLTVSYILRNTAASDTLMQMARWFGYRPGYEDICRVYLPQLALNHYREINGAIEELRDEVRRMHDLGMTPEHFGLKVRESPTAIRITAANKMRTATQMTIAQDYSERHLEGYILPNSQDVNQTNLDAARAFVATLGAPSAELSTRQAEVWERKPGGAVMTLLKAFRFSPAHGDLGPISGDVSLFEDYFGDRLRDEMAEWDVAIPHPAGGEPVRDVLRPDLSFPLRGRNSGDVVDGGFRVNKGRNRVADPDDAQIGLDKDQLAAGMQERKDKVRRGDKAFCAQRIRPLVLIHVFTTDGTTEHLRLSGPIVTLSFCLPSTRKRTPERSYQVNAVYRKQIEAALAREDEDDDEAVQAGEI